MIAISTYSGECDGLGLAAEMAGIEVAAYCEADPKRRAKLAEKHPGKPIFESDEELTADAIRTYRIEPDFLFGGPPCQPFSVAGAGRGEADPRHRWPHMLRFIREYRPRWVLVENVGGFVNLALDLVLSDLEDEGYEAGAVVLPALAVGAPHRRDRCFVVAYADDGYGEPGQEVRAGRDAAIYGSSMAHPVGSREPQREGQQPERGGRAGNGGQGVSAASGAGLQTGPGVPDGPHGGRGGAKRCGEGLGHPQGVRGGQGCLSGRNEAQKPMSDGGGQASLRRAAESRLGGILDGVCARLDQVKWPAWRGQEQHPWEPPRVAEKIPERPRRIESLGLAVVPWQAYPLMALIREMDDMLREVTP